MVQIQTAAGRLDKYENMIDLEFTHDNIPSSEELAELLQASVMPIDGLLTLYERLHFFETKYEMSSSEFIMRYANGELDDDPELIQWIGLYHITEILRLRIQNALCQAWLP